MSSISPSQSDPFQPAIARSLAASSQLVGRFAHAFPRFSPQRIILHALLIVGLLLLNKLGNPGAAVFFLVLLGMIYRGPDWAFMALTLGFVGLVANMAIVPKSLVWTPSRLILLFVCAVRFLIDLSVLRRSLFEDAAYWALCLFTAVAAVCSIISGYYLEIALLKLVSFFVGMTAVFAGVKVLRARRVDLSSWLLSIAAVFVINGFLAIGLGAGYGRDRLGNFQQFFQGPFYHANCCGPFCALLVVLLMAIWLFGPYRGRAICIWLALPVFYFIWLSKSRTGFASAVLGMAFVFLSSFLANRRRLVTLHRNTSRVKLIAGGCVLGLFVFIFDVTSQGSISKALLMFVNKYDHQKESIEMKTMMNTRQGLIDRGLQEFYRRPLTGLGFEVSLDDFFIKNATLFSAPIEKGFLPTALLEEVGILGTTAFVIFIGCLITSLKRQQNAPGLAMLLTFLVTNLGEVTVFSFGGPGGLGWTLVGAGMLIGDQCLVIRQPRPPMLVV